jgi:outer membrane protein assembly factor BamA
MTVLLGVLLLALPLGQPQSTDTTTASAQPDTSVTVDQQSASWLLLPFASYAPKTKISAGGVAGYYLPATRNRSSSSVQATFTVTQRRQLTLQITPELYLNNDDWRLQGTFEASHFPDAFFGIGGDTPAEAKEEYTARYLQLDARGQRRVRPHLRIGPRVFMRSGTVEPDSSSGLIAQEQVPGANGGQTIGLGGSVFWNARDNRYYPTTGTYAEAVATLFSAAWGSDYTYGQFTTDVRGYRSLGPGVLAGQIYAEAVIGEAPFQLLPLLGGSDHMRGYRGGRYRDNVYWTVQAEYRFPIFWRFKGTAFASVGEVGPRLGTTLTNNVEAAVGLGGRLQFTDDGVHGRLDVAYSRTGLEFYISLGEAF